MEHDIVEDGEYSIVTMYLEEYKYVFYYKPNNYLDDLECVHCKKIIKGDTKHYVLDKEYPEIPIIIVNKGKKLTDYTANTKDDIYRICPRCYNTHVQDKSIDGLFGFISLLKVKDYI